LEEKQGKRTKRRQRKEERVSLEIKKIMSVQSLQQATSGKETTVVSYNGTYGYERQRGYLRIQEAMTVLTDTRGYDGT